ncbi:MAG: hypothetical protein HC927_02145 [Deltaproteobacteria bacterium]|nr:hypothetical protein [Deltaproteobacteria bacterium]
MEVAAMWAVLTRLKRPDPMRYAEPVKSIVKRMTPIEKLRLYDAGIVPSWVAAAEAPLLVRAVKELRDEHRSEMLYEGHLGASAREMRTIILNAAHHPRYRCLTPLPVFDELRELVRDRTLYDFLKQEPRDGYYDNEAFVVMVRRRRQSTKQILLVDFDLASINRWSRPLAGAVFSATFCCDVRGSSSDGLARGLSTPTTYL